MIKAYYKVVTSLKDYIVIEDITTNYAFMNIHQLTI